VALPPVWRALREQAQKDKANGTYHPAPLPLPVPAPAPVTVPAPVHVHVPVPVPPVAAGKDDDLGMD
jgi:hypothetical protein